MKLIIFGKEVDASKELELECYDKAFGLKATIKFNKELVPNYSDETRHNLTEFHHLYNKSFEDDLCKGEDWTPKYKSAFESDIHSTGCTQPLIHMDKVVIEYDNKLHNYSNLLD